MTKDKLDNNSNDSHGQDFMQLYLVNERRIYGFILALVPNWSDADDLLQETTAVMWSKFNEFTPGTDFVGWALSIARYRVLNFLKKKNSHGMKFSNDVLDSIQETVTSTNDVQNELHHALRNCIAKLRDRDKKLLDLRYEYGADTKTVAQRVGRGIDAVYKALNRIHDQLFYCIQRTLAMEKWL